jgi:hypothetical protein
MKILEALEEKNVMLVNGNRWLVLNNGTYKVFEHKFRKVTDVEIYSGDSEEAAVKFLVEGVPGSDLTQKA